MIAFLNTNLKSCQEVEKYTPVVIQSERRICCSSACKTPSKSLKNVWFCFQWEYGVKKTLKTSVCFSPANLEELVTNIQKQIFVCVCECENKILNFYYFGCVVRTLLQVEMPPGVHGKHIFLLITTAETDVVRRARHITAESCMSRLKFRCAAEEPNLT